MKNLKFGLLASLGVLLAAAMVQGGTWSGNQFIYKPAVGARGAQEKALYDQGQDRLDSRLGNEVWLNDPRCGGTLAGALAYIGSAEKILRLPVGTYTVSDKLTIPPNVTLAPERGAVCAVTIPDTDIQGITRANPAVVTWPGHNLATGDKVHFSGIAQYAWTYLNEIGACPITRIDADHFYLGYTTPAGYGLDTSSATLFPDDYNASTDPGKISKVMEIKGGLQAGNYQIFNAPAGKITFGPQAHIRAVNPAWWGAVAMDNDYQTPVPADCSPAIQAAVYALNNSGGAIEFAGGRYQLNTGVTLQRQRMNTSGTSRWKFIGNGAILDLQDKTNQFAAIFRTAPPHQGFLNFLSGTFIFENFYLRGVEGEAYRQFGLDVNASFNSEVRNCQFAYFDVGCRMAYAFWNSLRNCNFYRCALDAGVTGKLAPTAWPGAGSAGGTTSVDTVHFAGVRSDIRQNLAGISRTNPARITWSSAHHLVDGDLVFLNGITQSSGSNEWQQLNYKRCFVKVIDGTHTDLYTDIELATPINTGGYTTDFVPGSNLSNGYVVRYVYAFRTQMGAGFRNIGIEQGGIVDGVALLGYGTGANCNADFYNIFTEVSANTLYGATVYMRDGGRVTIDGLGFDVEPAIAIDARDTQGKSGTFTFKNLPGNAGRRLRGPDGWNYTTPIFIFENCDTNSELSDYATPAYWLDGLMPKVITRRNYDGTYHNTASGETGGAAQSGKGFRAGSAGNLSYIDKSGGLGCFDPTYGSAMMMQQMTTERVINGGATQGLSNLIPAGATVVGVSCRVTQTISNTGLTGFDIGDGTTQDIWGKDIGLTAGTTSDGTSGTASGPKKYAANTNIVLTAKGANFGANGKVRVTVHYLRLGAPNS